MSKKLDHDWAQRVAANELEHYFSYSDESLANLANCYTDAVARAIIAEREKDESPTAGNSTCKHGLLAHSCVICMMQAAFTTVFSNTVTAKRDRDAARDHADRLDIVRGLLEKNGCDCECRHDSEGHDEACDRCLACRIAEAVTP